MKKPKIYIAGKVTGLAVIEVTAKFGIAQKKIQDSGFEVINPLEVVCEKADGWHTNWQTAMKVCIEAMMTADAVYLLPCWEQSKGAKIEKKLAQDLEMLATDSIWKLKKHFFNG